MATSEPDPQATMAAELALGVLDGEERAAALRRMLADPAFAREVETWRAHFALLFEQVPEVPASDAVAGRIEAALTPQAATGPVRLWRTVAGIAVLAAACLAAVLVWQLPASVSHRPAPAPAPLVAAMVPTGGGEPVVATIDRNAGIVRVAAASLAPPGKSAQLWLIPADGKPRSLGLLGSHAASSVHPGAGDIGGMTAGATLAISIEPQGGSPTGQPTGPVVAGGKITAI